VLTDLTNTPTTGQLAQPDDKRCLPTIDHKDFRDRPNMADLLYRLQDRCRKNWTGLTGLKKYATKASLRQCNHLFYRKHYNYQLVICSIKRKCYRKGYCERGASVRPCSLFRPGSAGFLDGCLWCARRTLRRRSGRQSARVGCAARTRPPRRVLDRSTTENALDRREFLSSTGVLCVPPRPPRLICRRPCA
jgi:hypothetical protein